MKEIADDGIESARGRVSRDIRSHYPGPHGYYPARCEIGRPAGDRSDHQSIEIADVHGGRTHGYGATRMCGDRYGDSRRGIRFRSEEHTSELQSLIPLSSAVLCL